MKQVPVICLIVFAFSCQPNVPVLQGKNSLTEMNLKGRVKSVTQTLYNAGGHYQKNRIEGRDLYKFDENGNLVEHVIYDEKTGQILDRYVYSINNAGMRESAKRYSSDGTLYATYFYKYDEEGRLFEDTWYNAEGTLHTINNYRYDSNGNQVIKYTYKPYTPEFITTRSVFDKDGNKIREGELAPGADTSTLPKTRFDKLGREIETIFKRDTVLYKTSYVYDDNGELLSKISMENNRIVYSSRNDYSKIDKPGNWLLQTSFTNGKPIFYTEREITYY